jgi:hypothetical protein
VRREEGVHGDGGGILELREKLPERGLIGYGTPSPGR